MNIKSKTFLITLCLLVVVGLLPANHVEAQPLGSDDFFSSFGYDYCDEFCGLYGLEYGEFAFYKYRFSPVLKTYENNEEFYNQALGDSLKGKVLLQVEEHGEAYYIHPDDSLGYYLKNGEAAYTLMRLKSLGISESDFEKLKVSDDPFTVRSLGSVCGSDDFSAGLAGRVMLRPEAHGEAYYIDPETCRAVYIRDGQVAYDAMRFLSLGITNADLSKIPTIKLSGDLGGTANQIVNAPLENPVTEVIDSFIYWELKNCDLSEFVDNGNEQTYSCTKDYFTFDGTDGLTQSLTTNYLENSVVLTQERFFHVFKEKIGDEMTMDIPFLINQSCVGQAYEGALQSAHDSEFASLPEETRYELNLQDDKAVPTVFQKDVYYDSHGTKFASCTFPLIDYSLYQKHGNQIFEEDFYKQLIDFEVFYNFDPVESGGYVIGDLDSGYPNRQADFYKWYIQKFEDESFWYYDIPPWIDTENRIFSYFDLIYSDLTNTPIIEPMTYEFPGVLEASRINSKQIRMETEKGTIIFELFADTAPNTVSNFVYLTEEGYYDGLTFHRVVSELNIIQGGDPDGAGTGGPGYSFDDELEDDFTYDKGMVAMANSGPNTNGSQFFIMTDDFAGFQKNYTIFGRVTSGLEVANQIEMGDRMLKVTVESK